MADADLPLLEASDVTVRHDGQTILDRVSLAVAAGSVHLVIGPNGAGKSSLLAALLGQITFTGTVRCHFRGTGKIGFVPQTFAIDRTLPVTVTELLALPRQRFPVCLGVRPATRARVQELLARVGLEGLHARRLGALSGGELRRVLLANALDPVPELLLLDEPGSGLDEESVARMEETLLALRAGSGTTVLMVSHDRAQVRRLADRVTLLDRSVRREGTPAEVLAEPASVAPRPGAPARENTEPTSAPESLRAAIDIPGGSATTAPVAMTEASTTAPVAVAEAETTAPLAMTAAATTADAEREEA